MAISKVLSNIRLTMEKNIALRETSKLLKHFGIIHMLHVLTDIIEREANKEKYCEFIEYYNIHKNDYEKTSNILEEESRELYNCILNRLGGGGDCYLTDKSLIHNTLLRTCLSSLRMQFL